MTADSTDDSEIFPFILLLLTVLISFVLSCLDFFCHTCRWQPPS